MRLHLPFLHRRHLEDALARQAARHRDQLAKRDRKVENLRKVLAEVVTEREHWKGRYYELVADRTNRDVSA